MTRFLFLISQPSHAFCMRSLCFVKTLRPFSKSQRSIWEMWRTRTLYAFIAWRPQCEREQNISWESKRYTHSRGMPNSYSNSGLLEVEMDVVERVREDERPHTLSFTFPAFFFLLPLQFNTVRQWATKFRGPFLQTQRVRAHFTWYFNFATGEMTTEN